MKPKILIIATDGFAKNIGHFMINTDYGKAIANAGGIPIVALSPKLTEEYFDLADGLLLTDGPEIHRGRYGKYYDPTEEFPLLNREREEMELKLCEMFSKSKKPILGIGRGMQMINVFFGGTLCDNMRDFSKHIKTVEDKTEFTYHNVIIDNQSYKVNSAHKSAVQNPGDNIIVTASAEDNTIEAIKHSSLPILGVQWHAEHESENDGISHKIFEDFISLCKEGSK